jgi:hypothetical protein
MEGESGQVGGAMSGVLLLRRVITLVIRASKRAAQPAIYACTVETQRRSFVAAARNGFEDLHEMR